MVGPTSRHHGGRQHAATRDTDDTAIILAPQMGILEEHQATIQQTNDFGATTRTRDDYRSRNRKFIKFIFEKYPDLYEHSTILLSDTDRSDRSKYYTSKDMRDLTYTGLNPDVFIAFLSEQKTKQNGKLSSYSHLNKYYCAIKWGSTTCSRLLPSLFYSKVETFMKNYKKEFTGAKASGQIDEKESDAINSTLFKHLMTWAVCEGNIFIWCFGMLMWHLMARSINIDSLSLHHMKRGVSDSIIFKYDETKMDKSGEFVQEKNCYSNPLPDCGHLCLFTALGCYLSIHSDKLADTETLFLVPGSKLRTAAQNFSRQMKAMAERAIDTVKQFVRWSHFTIHGFRKGSGTHAASATTCPPLFTSIAARGEWSMGKVLDIYFQFAQGGDHYLGQLLSLKDPNSVDFNTPCPHWKDPNATIIQEAIELTFGKVYTEHVNTNHDPSSVLSILLASMVHHSSWILGIMEKYPNHPFGKIPLLNSDLLHVLKSEHITMELNEHVPIITGVPPHVNQLREIINVKNCCYEIKDAINTLTDTIKETIIRKSQS